MTGIRPAALEIRVTDIARAYRFYEGLFGWTLPDHTLLAPSASRIETLITDDTTAPPVRLWLEAADPDAALDRFRDLGGTADDIPVGFRSARAVEPAPAGDVPDGEMGVVILGVPDTAKACRLFGDLCGWTFHQIRQDDRWWMDNGPVGVFQSDLMNIDLEPSAEMRNIVYFYAVPDLDQALETVRNLGGRTLAPAMMGLNPVCGCYDDQGTRFGLCVIPR